MLKKISLLICISIVVISMDQLTKIFIQTQFGLHDTKSIIDGLLNITYARNYGAAFGFLEQSNSTFRDLFMLSVPPVICLIILVLIFYIKTDEISAFKNNILQLLSLSFIFGGALGNYIDRLHYGYVIDFVDFHIQKYSFATFNIADCSVVVGVLLLIISLYQEKKYETHN